MAGLPTKCVHSGEGADENARRCALPPPDASHPPTPGMQRHSCAPRPPTHTPLYPLSIMLCWFVSHARMKDRPAGSAKPSSTPLNVQ